MSYNLTVTDNITPHLAKVMAGLSAPRVNPRIAAKVEQTFRMHFRGLDNTNANDLGGDRTHFYADAAKLTVGTALADGVMIRCGKEGIMQRWKGGTITAGKTSNWLTIPARAEAYGHRARDFDNLRLAIFANSGTAALISGSQGASRTRKTASGSVSKSVSGAEAGVVMFWLKKSVNQKPDPDVIPSEEVIKHDINEMMIGYMARLGQRGGEA